MSLLTQVLHERLKNDAALQALVGSYNGEPAIFSSPEVPADYKTTRPYVWVLQSDADEANETKLSRGRQIARTIWCAGPSQGSWSVVESIAARVRALLHRKPLSGTDSANGDIHGWKSAVSGPVRVESDRSVVCLALTLDFTYSIT